MQHQGRLYTDGISVVHQLQKTVAIKSAYTVLYLYLAAAPHTSIHLNHFLSSKKKRLFPSCRYRHWSPILRCFPSGRCTLHSFSWQLTISALNHVDTTQKLQQSHKYIKLHQICQTASSATFRHNKRTTIRTTVVDFSLCFPCSLLCASPHPFSFSVALWTLLTDTKIVVYWAPTTALTMTIRA